MTYIRHIGPTDPDAAFYFESYRHAQARLARGESGLANAWALLAMAAVTDLAGYEIGQQIAAIRKATTG